MKKTDKFKRELLYNLWLELAEQPPFYGNKREESPGSIGQGAR
jgi:hypothetical protein